MVMFEIERREFEAIKKTGTNGRVFWRFPGGDESGSEIEAWVSGLPSSLSCAGETFAFGRVPRRVKKSDGSVSYKPFEKAREVRGQIFLDGEEIDLHCRVTVRKNNKYWWIWLHLDPRNTKLLSEKRKDPSRKSLDALLNEMSESDNLD